MLLNNLYKFKKRSIQDSESTSLIDGDYVKNASFFYFSANKCVCQSLLSFPMTGFRHKAASVLSEILCETYRDKKPEQFSDVRIYPSVKYIDEHCFSQDLSLCKAAEVSFVSEVYFRKLFKREFGISPKKYVINKRIEYAVSLLEAGYHSLKEIAYMCGYSDYKYFSVEFKKATGRSPSEYVL